MKSLSDAQSNCNFMLFAPRVNISTRSEAYACTRTPRRNNVGPKTAPWGAERFSRRRPREQLGIGKNFAAVIRPWNFLRARRGVVHAGHSSRTYSAPPKAATLSQQMYHYPSHDLYQDWPLLRHNGGVMALWDSTIYYLRA